MEQRHFSLTEDEKKDRWAKTIVSFLFIGAVISLLFFFSVTADEVSLRWKEYILYFGRIVNPAGILVSAFLIMWFLALLEYHQYLKVYFVNKSSSRILLNKIADKMYDLFPRLFLVMGGCIFTTCILEIIFLPYNSNIYFYLFFQSLIGSVATVVGFTMLLPRRLMLNTLITGWLQFYAGIKKIGRSVISKNK